MHASMYQAGVSAEMHGGFANTDQTGQGVPWCASIRRPCGPSAPDSGIHTDIVAQATLDGYTLVLLPSGYSSNAAMKKNLLLDPVNDFAWVFTVTTYPLMLSVKSNSPITPFRDFIQRVKSEPHRYTCTSVDVMTDTMTATAPLFKENQARVLARTAPAVQNALPDVPSVADSFTVQICAPVWTARSASSAASRPSARSRPSKPRSPAIGRC
jgi:tripartite-type tricarboxylate transporter receptor subunit TctC